MQAALAAAQHGAGHLLRAAAPIMTPQVPRPPTSAGLGLDLSSLRLHSSSPTPAPRPQKVCTCLVPCMRVHVPSPTAACHPLICYNTMLASAVHALQPDMALSHNRLCSICSEF